MQPRSEPGVIFDHIIIAKAYFHHLLRAVPTRNAFFEE